MENTNISRKPKTADNPKPRKKFKFRLDTFAILLIVILLVSLLTWAFNGKTFELTTDEGVKEFTVHGATLADIFMSPIHGLKHGLGIIGFVFCLGAFLALVNATGALETGIKALVRKMKGRELILIPILMFIFGICGSTYGMCEETVGFYILLAATMYAAGMDPIVGCATVLLGAGVGVLGSTVNPFAVGAAMSAAGVEVDSTKIIVQGLILWLATYAVATTFVCLYAKKVLKDKGSTILTLQELKNCEEAYGKEFKEGGHEKLTSKQVVVLIIFGFTFLVMILSFIVWQDVLKLSDEQFAKIFGWSKYLTGAPLGEWYFDEAAMWFLFMGIVIGLVGMKDRSKLVPTIIAGCADMIGVNIVIALSHASAQILEDTYLGKYLVVASVNGISKAGLPQWLFMFLDYLLHIGLSFLVPSSSGLASISSPIVSPIVHDLKWSVPTSIMAYCAASGVVNLITPTNGAIMGGLALTKVEYSTWVKWSWKPIVTIALVSGLLIVLFSFIF